MPDFVCRGREQLQAVANRIACQLSPDKVWRITVSVYKSRRSNDQNRLAFAIYQAIADETGHSVDEVHVICKHKFGEPTVYRLGDTEVTEYRTRDKDSLWMGNYLDRLQAWAASELGVSIG